MAKNDLQGTLDLLILKSLAQTSSMHGYGIVLHIEKVSGELLRIEEGSLYPALHRMEQNLWIRSTWALTETNRRAKFYSLTPTGRKQLAIAEKSWEQTVKGVQAVMRFA
ncbi:PadR family transcriptional regulator [Edaphobacter aggregans]|uniref:PadR family transcriptional regulator n=1 Tax=Edaphobacter aggregans TaxID=570835 RepID=A0A428MJC4_9BACT|nr:PadR family transcriptional regulator [Edaphobacter aggregans]RSL16823.1 PadR family transcriptional regulator [Edaphobacter aggregans]